MHRYRAFALTIGSDVQLDELAGEPDRERPVDLRIVRGDAGYPVPPPGSPTHFDFEDPAGVLMVWPGVAAIRIADPGRVVIAPYPGVPENYLAFPLLGPVMAWVLHMRGMFVLHASAVVREGHGIAFLGDKTAGKSTTATAFLAAGAELLTDDLLAIDIPAGEAPRALPAFAQLKLDAAGPGAGHVAGASAIPLVMDGFQKRQFRLERMHRQPAPIDCIFVLERGGEVPAIEWFDDAGAIAALIRFSYNVRFADAPVEQQERARGFRQAVSLVNRARIGRLTIPHSLERLPEAVALVDDTIGAGVA